MGSGSDFERTFVRMFNEETPNWKAQRAAASGSATTADLPDVTFARDGHAFAGELKTTSKNIIYVDEEEVAALRRYAYAYGMTPVLLGRLKGERAYYVWNPDHMDRTDSGRYRGDPRNPLEHTTDEYGWCARIAEPDSSAPGVYPHELTPVLLLEAVHGATEPLDAQPGHDKPPEVSLLDD